MRQLIFAGLSLLLPCAASAADPQGEWLDAHGLARIRIADCNGHLWGATVWEKEPGGLDTHNPDPAKRSRPTLGAPLLLDMKPVAGKDRWDGQVYDSENGKTYTASIRMLTATTLEIKGCVAFGMLCGGETWTRYVDPAPPASASASPMATGAVKGAKAPPVRSAALPVPPAPAAKPAATATASSVDFCAAVIAAK